MTDIERISSITSFARARGLNEDGLVVLTALCQSLFAPNADEDPEAMALLLQKSELDETQRIVMATSIHRFSLDFDIDNAMQAFIGTAIDKLDFEQDIGRNILPYAVQIVTRSAVIGANDLSKTIPQKIREAKLTDAEKYELANRAADYADLSHPLRDAFIDILNELDSAKSINKSEAKPPSGPSGMA